ncbi:autotransporter outer membrane beta-barrel domain-containing protein [Mesorhizobium qingshengii]|uniref:Outer membrane autotransporter barrel domain-containing protein n=1 Tax=Mesorhizobium qingshengii TaxID=1165689 RepID=A0A1G5Z6A7_9HYPH|nr:autotransporter outer membrane beta-barrel domain-containing protein [Mesorhizobium qingshengii]SDA90609.1 outer membrane autotransporter barrel domain-containing protein [Mesorhizobium qingshengii]
MTRRFLRSDGPTTITTLAAALALSVAPAWADGGNGAGAGAGQGGVDGALSTATGQDAANGATAGGGGGGVDLTTGNGAPGGSGGTAITFNAPNGVAGATGATGQVISTSGTISTSVSGGTGGPGSNGVSGVVRGGGGGGGGVGVSATADTVVTGSGSVTGGTGGLGGSNSNGGGGGGGVGVFSSANVTVEAGGSVTGGVGGRGSSQSGGGGGAAAVVLTGGGTVQNSGNLVGGTGGRTLAAAGGGDGGAGVLLLSGGTVINGTGATITGGTGGQAGAAGTAGDGGAGIKGANIAIINAGTISGGAVGAGGGTPVAGKAIEFTGGVNSLEIQAGSIIAGNVVAFGAADTFKLGGDSNASFDVSQIGAGAKYDGFGFYEKTGNSTWTLTGTTTAVTPWTLTGGILQISSDNNLGAPSGGLTFNGGTLETTADITSARTIALAGGGTFLTDPSTTLTLTNVISGAGGLMKAGDGTLVLTGANTYAGGTTITAGTLIGDAASIRGDIGNAGIVVFDQTGDASFAGDISGTGTMVKDGAGTLTLTGISVLDWTIDQGGLVSAAERFGGDVAIGAGASFTFDQVADASYAGVLSGAGTFVKDGLGILVLASDNSAFTGATPVNGGTLAAGAANAFSSSSQFSVASGATLDLAGTSQTLAGLTNAGTVRIAGGGLGNTLTISGDYAGNGGTVILNTALGGDGSATDMLVIAGDTSGTGTLQVVNFGGAGGQTAEGIKIVDVGGVSNGTFSLKGDYTFEGDAAVVGGAYAYRLYQGGTSTPADGDWYLRSALIDDVGPETPLYQAGAPLYEAYAGVLQTFNQLGTLDQRLGNRSWTVEAQGADGISDEVKAEAGIGLWGRIEGTSGSYDPESSATATTYDTSTWRLQTGADMLLSDSTAGQLIGGVAFQYGTVSADVSSVFGSGSIDTTGTGVSGSLTWYGAEGFYLDGQAQVIWYDSNLDSATAGQRLADGNNGVGYALGVEAGKRIMLDPSWSLTPQAQLAWSSVDFDSFTDAFGARVALGSGDSLLGRLGLSLDHQTQWQDRTGRGGRTNVYGLANLYYDFEDGSSVDLAGSSLSSRNEQLWGGLGIGGTINWADDKFSVFGEAVARTGLKDFGDSYALTGTLGFRTKW